MASSTSHLICSCFEAKALSDLAISDPLPDKLVSRLMRYSRPRPCPGFFVDVPSKRPSLDNGTGMDSPHGGGVWWRHAAHPVLFMSTLKKTVTKKVKFPFPNNEGILEIRVVPIFSWTSAYERVMSTQELKKIATVTCFQFDTMLGL